MVIFVAPVDDKCLNVDSVSGLLLFSRITEIESRISFSNISVIFKYYYQINITHPSTAFPEPSVKHCGLQMYTQNGRSLLSSEYLVLRVCGEIIIFSLTFWQHVSTKIYLRRYFVNNEKF